MLGVEERRGVNLAGLLWGVVNVELYTTHTVGGEGEGDIYMSIHKLFICHILHTLSLSLTHTQTHT